MSFSYDPTTVLGRVRFLIQDNVSARAQFSDEEIDAQLAQYAQPPTTTTANLCAADLCFLLATKFAQQVTRTVGKVTVAFSDRVKFYQDLEKRLRQVFMGDAEPWAGGLIQAEVDANNADMTIIHNYFTVGSDPGRDDNDATNW